MLGSIDEELLLSRVSNHHNEPRYRDAQAIGVFIEECDSEIDADDQATEVFVVECDGEIKADPPCIYSTDAIRYDSRSLFDDFDQWQKHERSCTWHTRH